VSWVRGTAVYLNSGAKITVIVNKVKEIHLGMHGLLSSTIELSRILTEGLQEIEEG
jgi:hypothetical protein